VLCGVNPIPVTVAAGPADLILLRVFLFAIVLFLGFRRRQISVHLGLCWPPPIRFSLSRCCCARSQSTILIFFPREVPRSLFRWSRTESNSVPGFFFAARDFLSALSFPLLDFPPRVFVSCSCLSIPWQERAVCSLLLLVDFSLSGSAATARSRNSVSVSRCCSWMHEFAV
jgi:hypothetical protein